MELIAPEATLPPQFAGLIASAIGMIAGSLGPQLKVARQPLHRPH
jgi:hypothetical protein